VQAVLLLNDFASLACIASICAIFFMHQGTYLSIKNLSWGLLAWAACPATITAWFLRQSLSSIDPERGYTLYVLVDLLGKGIEVVTGMVLFLVLGLAFSSKLNE
jgi:hypothetical protein